MLFYTRSLLVWLLLLMATEVLAVESVQDSDSFNTDEAAVEEQREKGMEENANAHFEAPDDEPDVIDAFPEESSEDAPKEQKDMLSVLDSPHKYVSEQVEWLVTGVDKYFANEAFYNYSTDSYVQLSADVLYEEEFADTSYGANLRARVDLPRTKRRFKLLIDTDPTEKQDPIERSVDESPAAAVQESDVYASIQRERERKGWLIRPSVGAKFNFPIEPFVKLQFTNLFPLQRWQLRVNETLYWYDDSGFGSDSTFDFDLPVGNVHLLRTTSFARWTEETNYFELNQIITFFQTPSPTRRISYQIGAYGQTSPTLFMTNYLAVIRYRQNIYKDWLFFEIRPQVLYRKINDWDDEVSLLLRLEWLFGRKYL
jgi:hypothetical protein